LKAFSVFDFHWITLAATNTLLRKDTSIDTLLRFIAKYHILLRACQPLR